MSSIGSARALVASLALSLLICSCTPGASEPPECEVADDCASGICSGGACALPTCSDGVVNDDETDIDCGGSCPDVCTEGEGCLGATDCQSGVCTAEICQAASCTDLVVNGDETDVDCGGSCPEACADDAGCALASDCLSGVCATEICQAASCTDLVVNGDETDVDCGGSCPDACAEGEGCLETADCVEGICAMEICQPATCIDGLMNGDETDVDCGGSCAMDCDDGEGCGDASDCSSGVCTGDLCQVPTCMDMVANGDETDADCGGSCPLACDDGDACSVPVDCLSGVCTGDLCQVPTCMDMVVNGDETDVDCGGSCSMDCARGEACLDAGDCSTDDCVGNVCVVGPSAAFTLDLTTGVAPLDVNATSMASVGDAAIVLTEYDFGAGAGFTTDAIFAYASEGVYMVRQRVTDGNGLSTTSAPQLVTVEFSCRLSATDKSSDFYLRVLPNGLAVELVDLDIGGVRSECAIHPGDGVFYYEATIQPYDCNVSEAPEGCVNTPFGSLFIGVATSAAPLDAGVGQTAEGFCIETSGPFYTDGTYLGSIARDSTDSYGFIVDYRGASPTVRVVGDNWGSPDLVRSETLSAITSPIHAMISGFRRKVGVETQVNFGNDLANAPFRFDPDAILRANALDSVADALILGFGGSRAGTFDALPTLMVGADVSIALGESAMVSGVATDAEDGDLTASIVWEDLATVYGSRTGGTGGSFIFTPTQIGDHPMRATVTDSGGGRRFAVVMVTVTGTLPQYDPVELVNDPMIDPNVGSGIDVSPDGLSALWTIDDKMAIRANQGNLGDFWYFEFSRLTAPANQGGGLAIWEGDLDPYSFDNVPPSLSINALTGTWQNYIFHGGYDNANDTYGFAVDYRGQNPIVYWVVGDEVVDEWLMYDVFVPIYPMLYGNTTSAGLPYDASINFGATAFAQDPCVALTNWGVSAVDVTQLSIGWGDVNATSTCP